MFRFFMGLLAIIGLIVILIILLVPGKKTSAPGSNLVGYANTGVEMRLTIDGPEIYQTNHQLVEITVSKNYVTYQQFVGYNGQVVNEQSYPNTVAAYDTFLHGLYYDGFYLGNKSASQDNPTGRCPSGTRYTYEIVNGSSDVDSFWSDDCGAKTYGGSIGPTQWLFENQVPNYDALVTNLNL
jgi:hypothetical protein